MSAASRPWYLPICVSRTRPFTSPIAYSQGWPGTRMSSSTASRLVVVDADRLEADPAVRGRRPRAASTSSASNVVPSSSSIETAPAARLGSPDARAEHRRRTSRASRGTWAPANGSSRSISRSAAVDERHLRAEQANTPGRARHRRRRRRGPRAARGTSLAVVASMFVHGRASRSPSMSGISAAEPVATITAFRATSSSLADDDHARSPSSRPRPRTSVTPCSSSHGTWPESSRFGITSSRRASTAGDVDRPDLERPAIRRTSRTRSTGRSSAFDGMQA